MTDDTAKAEVPLSADSEECFVAGISLDFSSTKPVEISTLCGCG